MAKLKVSGKSDVGQKRTNNQDSFLINESLGLFAVADGMGGHSGGEVASALAVRTLEKVFAEARATPVAVRLEQAIHLCNQVIYEQAQVNPALLGMGTTLTAVAVEKQFLHIGQVGDSRCYMYNNTMLFQITEDHSQVYELIKAGLISEANMNLVHRNVITRSVGYEQNVQVDIFTRFIQPGDKYLLCSDGLTGMVSNEQIARVLQNFDIEQSVTNLVDLANLQGGEDNVSAIVFGLDSP